MQNSYELAQSITEMNIKMAHKIITYNIKDLYINLPIEETIRITKNWMTMNNINEDLIKQYTKLIAITLNQNYFEYHGTIYKPT
jgi:hypothetical protein